MPGSITSFNGPVLGQNNVTAANFAAVSTIEELNAITPKSFGPRFSVLYRKYCDTATKASHAQATLSNFERHYANGTFPPCIQGSLKSPTVQVTKEFDGTSEQQALTAELDSVIFNARKSSLENAISLKKKEHEFLLSLLQTEEMKKVCKEAITEVHDLLGPTFAQGIDKDGHSLYSDFYSNELSYVKAKGVELLRKAVAIGFAKHQRELVAKMSKLKLKKDTDEAMGDMPVNDVNKAIQQAVSAALKARDNKKPQPKGAKKSTCDQRMSNDTTDDHSYISQDDCASQQKAAQTQGVREKSRKRKWEREQETEAKLKILSSKVTPGFNAKDAFSYPDEFFQSDEHTRKRFMLLHSSTDFVDSIPAYQADCFIGPGVALEKQYRQQLSLNGKFVLHAQRNNMLLPKALAQLRRTIRIRWFFRDESSQPYIAKFRTKSEWTPPKASIRVEKAIDHVERALLSQASLLPSRSYHLNPETSSLCKYLREKGYLVKITDKNLGLAVVSSEWYLEQCKLHLSQAHAYEEVAHVPYGNLNTQYHAILKLPMDKEIRKYFETSTTAIPRFHVIPKVHKTPWAARPIIPSHSWITSRASEILDYFLQKECKQYDFVLDSTKKFITQLKKIKTDDKCILVTGDVKAMYTSIPLDKAKVTTEHALQSADKGKVSYGALVQMMNFVLGANYFLYQGKAYKQKNGIAMGTACAPAVANLYAAYYEKSEMMTWQERGVLYYGRYIDDIFMVFRGSFQELESLLPSITIPGLEITWTYSKTSTPFLDVEVRLSKTGELSTTLFRKGLNRYMYIPFSSGHPLSVKKALVKAERTRMKTICSSQKDLSHCEELFRLNLFRRGYPSGLLQKWFSDDLKPRTETKALFLPSEYNPAWEYINMSKLEEAWAKHTQSIRELLPESLRDTRFIKCLKRNRNLYDMFHRENLTILSAEAELGTDDLILDE